MDYYAREALRANHAGWSLLWRSPPAGRSDCIPRSTRSNDFQPTISDLDAGKVRGRAILVPLVPQPN